MKLPNSLKSILWSYNLKNIDINEDVEVIVRAVVNYGDLSHWRWLVKVYGKSVICKVLSQTPQSALRPRVLRLASLIFGVEKFKYVSRSPK